ncbi:SDR family oxidoreductase [Nocardioides sp. cx-169]|uniref:SDR family NAD(P)-dependent oxidoreductase n=1 Tax=Nocardioides sp. cx-169 TaxID=2899080 RepID=UPI001E33B69A|nr:SDR family NAD(P)-dependent oxidoreductase [Nocardioides sp. cx-169]MCD4533641.1 SDR family oxidoreductase [Nocardioides sp. cx-169]
MRPEGNGRAMERVAFVTGGASGMGLSICEHLAREGHAVAVVDLDQAKAQEAADAIRESGGKAIACVVDVSDREQVEDAVKQTQSDLGTVGIVVTSAGVARSEPFVGISLASWNQVMAVNLTGTFNCVQTVVPGMIEAGWGRVVLISSSSAQRGAPTMTHYAASKGGVIAFGKTLALELAPQGITVNNIAPSAIWTPMVEQQQSGGALGSKEALTRNIPVGRLGTGDDIAAACTFLCSDGASYVTGQTISVNGGSFVGW